MHRRVGAVLLVVLLGASVVPATVSAAPTPPPDPPTDVIGWEAGYWFNESIAVDQSDGLTDAELDAVVSRTMARVERIREREFNRTVPVSVQSSEAFTDEQFDRDPSDALRVFDNAKFEALFMIDEETDSIAVQRENAGSSVLGYYHSGRGTIVLIADEGQQLEVDELVLAHELAHALQDQHFEPLKSRNMTRDEVNGVNGIVEGDPKYVEFLYRQRCENGNWTGTCLRPSTESGGGTLANMGPYLLEYQPYSDGPSFVDYQFSRGGWAAVDAVYSDPPVSSEQVIHPEKYPADRPTNITLTDNTSDVWHRVRPPGRPDYAVFGEAGMATMFVYPTYDSNGRTQIIPISSWLNRSSSGDLNPFDPLNYGSRYSAGWDGDRLHVYQDSADRTAYAWRSVWDSESDAIEFADGYRQILAYRNAEQIAPDTYRIDEGGFADAFHLMVGGRTVTIVNAPTVDELSSVRGNVTVETPVTTTAKPTPGASPSARATTTVPSIGPTSARTTVPGQPGFGLAVGLVAILFAVVARRR